MATHVLRIGLLASVLLLRIGADASALSLYQVGNSFTIDSAMVGTGAMLEARLGEPVEIGRHLRGNTTIDFMWDNPSADGTLTSAHGDHTVALPNNAWDFITVQTFPSLSNPTLGLETATIQSFVGAADQGNGGTTEVIVYGPWAGRAESAWTAWDLPIEDDPGTVANYSSAYHDLLYDHVNAVFPDRTRLASVGKVIREIRDRIEADDAPFDRVSRLYRDFIHLSDSGRFVASTVLQTVVVGTSQIGQPVPREVWPEERLSDEQALWIQTVALDILLGDERSGVLPPDPGDYDADGDVDFDDKAMLDHSFGSTTRGLADGNRDGVVDALDYNVWRDAMGERVAAGDLNGDASVDLADSLYWREHYGSSSALAGDVNADGFVNGADFTALRDREFALGVADAEAEQDWRSEYGLRRWAPGDSNGDGAIDAADYTFWRDRYSPSGVAIPEASTFAIAGSALLGVVTASRPRSRWS